MDKSWMNSKKWSSKYVQGVKSFMEFVRDNVGEDCEIRCPCVDCLNVFIKTQKIVHDHLLIRGIDVNYSRWIYHGEQSSYRIPTSSIQEESTDDIEEEEDDGVDDMLDDLGNFMGHNEWGVNSDGEHDNGYFNQILNEAQKELYPGCKKFSSLSFIVKLLHLKVYNKWTNKSFDMLLELLKEAIPNGENLPKSHYEAKRVLRDLGLGYIPIHACKYDCELFWKEFAHRNSCPVCGTSRWKINDGTGKKIPHKVLRYFPLTPRLQRFFMSRKVASDMRWHKEQNIGEGNLLRHPADSICWQEFDKEYPWFSQDCRNVRLGLATDGFNPFGNMSNSYSMWPVVLVPYNLPPWKCMKDPFILMSLLIPGPLSPGKDIDVYLKPLVDELKMLWEDGVPTYDVSCGQTFQMHAAVLWTINDFPAYAYLSGWSTKGYMACPVCNKDTCCRRLNGKLCYMGHRRYLPSDHRWRKSKKFDGKTENGLPANEFSCIEILNQLKNLFEVKSGKHPSNKKRKRTAIELNWTKKSIFFELPYWQKMKLRHNLDVMHIEKNVCDNILGTLMSIEGKNKDTVKARLDLEDMNIRSELHLKRREDGSYSFPPACYTFSKAEREGFCQFLKSVKFPDGYASNISRCINVSDGKISGLKSHDCHVMLQKLIPIGVRGCLREDVAVTLAELGDFFQRLCSRTLKLDDVEKLEKDIVLILCKLELIYPPAFFDVMVHLAIHLPKEIKLGGPVQFRWMFPIERFLGTLKGYVRNRARPEGSIAEAYVVNESLTFCSMYLRGLETRFNREDRNVDITEEGGISVFSHKFRTIGAASYPEMCTEELDVMHWYVLINCEEVEPFIQKHMEELRMESRLHVEQRHKEQFPSWFRHHMANLYNHRDPEATEALYTLACGPHICVRTYTACIVNGVRFHTKERDHRRRTQNSGVVVEGNHGDNFIDFYGVLNDIIVLDYIKDKRVVLFKCEWFNLGDKMTGIEVEGTITSINVSSTWYKNDPFVLASQARQVFYLNDPKKGKNWRAVVHVQHRGIYEVGELGVDNNDDGSAIAEINEVYQENTTTPSVAAIEIDDQLERVMCRDDIDDEVERRTVAVSRGVNDELNGHDSSLEFDEEDDTISEYCNDDVDVESLNEDSDSEGE